VKDKKFSIINLLIIISSIVFVIALVALIFGDWLDQNFNVIGIRIATLFVAFASFCSSTAFSLLIFMHNRTVNRANDDANKRAELFRNLTFASSNYSIIEFMDRMLIYDESPRYVEKYIYKKNLDFHMIEDQVPEDDITKNPENYRFISIKIPFKVTEGKLVSSIILDKLKFKRDDVNYEFSAPYGMKGCRAYILYNEQTKRNNIIINLIALKDTDFWLSSKINVFSKISINSEIISLLGVRVKGVNELYFTNPEQIEGDGTNTYRINSSNFTLTEMPRVTQLYSKAVQEEETRMVENQE
jgi:hypothetical protein